MTRHRPRAFPRLHGALLALALALACAPCALASEEAAVILQTHEQRPWTLPADLERVAIADPAVADLVTLKNRQQALLVGKQAGQTTLLLWRRGQSAPQRLQVTVRSAVQQDLLQSQPLGLTVADGRALLQGGSDSMLDHERARQAAEAAAGDATKIIDTSRIATGGVVQVEVKVVEFNKSVLRQIGIQFRNTNGGFSYGITPPSSSASGGGEGGSNPLSSAFQLVAGSLTHQWDTNIDLLQRNGMARVLAEPTLVALSGQSANFLAGGELPILEPQGLGTTTVTFKPFGIGLTVTPTVLAGDRIALKVAPEASDLDYANGLSYNGVQIPSISTRRADTTVELGDGESFVIGGLVSNTLSSTVDKVPLLGDLPIIGSFFRSLNYTKQEKELVIVVTPHLVRPIARGTDIPLPGDREAQGKLPVWGAWLLHPAGPDALPGFSR
ncbi:type II and III secretion system protein family protein [Stenotrophomonas sp. HITSZ_GD]|uniref:type II and III secretion system protein family protein n=1 Tax=Stenotrophomonas sp. HITSZ_GD TaxID=3037248 RepID=UPI00240D846E|nr:type II and III secretion system protein family protein [Stenotrophomonas sp. HITSZ_GD]MDG2524441.1 type II and III secretion system protein family protein [Stenotrophomonas sp. HITSZ_GD]